MKRLSIRWRLTLWYGVVLSAIVVSSDISIYFLLRHYLLVLTDGALREEMTELAEEVGRAKKFGDLPAELGIRFASHEGYEFQVTTSEGESVFRSDGLKGGGLPLAKHSARIPIYETLVAETVGHARLAYRAARGPTGPLVVEVAVSLAPNDRALRELLAVLLTIGPLALTCALGGGYLLARKALAPVDHMAATAAEITASRLHRRLEARNPDDELGRLARTLNDMIERLERSFAEVRRFTADAAHELRTPLSMMRTTAEVALRAPRSPEQDGQVLEDLLEEVERLSRLVSQLLFLCREDVGLQTGPRRAVRLDEVVCEVVGHMQIMAQEKAVTLEVDCSRPCVVQGDQDRLRQLFFNLLDNAIKHTPPGGVVRVRDGSSNGRAEIVVADTGVGIPTEHLSHVFDRFYRVDPARGAEGGTGLGLSICRSITDAHQGRLHIESLEGQGTTVTFSLSTIDGTH
jgi:two-component system, OmpR family, heavy metal sensor histidine kinase CusS